MTCKDCNHYEVCLLGACVNGATGPCLNFKDKSKIIELPCNIGDTVYIVDEYSNEFDEIDKCEITSFGYNGVFIYFKIDKDNFCYSAGHIGKTVFLTYEEAEKKLREIENNDRQC